jgi:hypothetical protein
MGNDAKPKIKSKAAGDVTEFEIKVQSVKKESSYTIEIVKGGSTAKTLTGTWKDGKETKDGVPIAISGTTATVKWKAEGPEKTAKERAHRAFARVKVTDDKGKELKQQSQEIDVYLDEVEVTAEDDKGPVKGATFKVLLDKKPPKEEVKGKTDDKGKSTVKPIKAGTIGLEFQKPYELDEISERTAATVKAKVVLAKKASIVSPKANAARGAKKEKFLKQYVNLDPASDKKATNFGSQVKVELALKDAVAGDIIYVRQSFKNKSLRSDPSPVGVTTGTGTDSEVIEVKVDAKGKASITVELGKAGGFEVDLEVGGNKKVRDAKLKLVAYRKLFFQASAPPDIKKLPDLALFKQCFGEGGAYCELESLTKEPVALDPTRFPDGSYYEAQHVRNGATGVFLNLGEHNKTKVNQFWKADNAKKGPCFHLVLCNTLMDVGGNKTAKAKAKKGTVLNRWGESFERNVPGVHLTFDAMVFPINLKTGASAFVRGSWKEVGGSRRGSLSEADTEPQFRWGKGSNPRSDLGDYRYMVFVKLPADAVAVTEDGKEVEVELTMVTLDDDYAGFSAINGMTVRTLLIAANAGAQGAVSNVKAMNILIAHELGHGVGQACRLKDNPAKPWDPPPAALDMNKHGWQYDDTVAHSGKHCAFGLSEAEYGAAPATAGAPRVPGTGTVKSFYSLTKTTCVMYGEIDAENPTGTGLFCVKCQPYVQAHDLSSLP